MQTKIRAEQTNTDSATQTLTNKTLTTPKIDEINEATSGNGVSVDGLKIKDNEIHFNETPGTLYSIKHNLTDGALEIRSDNLVRFIESDSDNTALEFSLNNGGSITSSGRAYFEAKLTTGTFNASCDLVWNDEITDNTNSYSTSTGIFTAPYAGFYLFGFNILLNNAGSGEYRVGFYKNNSIWNVPIWRKPNANTWETILCTTATYMAASDTMRIKYTQGSGAIYTDANYNRFWGAQVL